jgi:hypothetical protein
VTKNILINSLKKIQLLFKCSSGVPPTTKESHVDPQTGHTQLEATATITKDMYEEYFGRQFSCFCMAWNSRGEAKSRAASVEVASKLILFPLIRYSIFYLFNCNLMMLEWIL